jgi:hypothetical protein
MTWCDKTLALALALVVAAVAVALEPGEVWAAPVTVPAGVEDLGGTPAVEVGRGPGGLEVAGIKDTVLFGAMLGFVGGILTAVVTLVAAGVLVGSGAAVWSGVATSMGAYPKAAVSVQQPVGMTLTGVGAAAAVVFVASVVVAVASAAVMTLWVLGPVLHVIPPIPCL